MHVEPLFLLTLHQQDCWCRHAVSLSWAQGIWCTSSLHLLQWAELRFVSGISDDYSEVLLFRASVQPWIAEAQGYRTAYESACFARQAGFVLMYLFMFLHNVLQCSTHGICYLHIGGLIIMSVGQIVLSAVHGIILFPSGEGGSSSTEACRVFWLLNQRIERDLCSSTNFKRAL